MFSIKDIYWNSPQKLDELFIGVLTGSAELLKRLRDFGQLYMALDD